MSLPRYPEYKDSGVDWLGKVPAHWQVQPLKSRYAVVGGSTPKSDVPEYWDGDIHWVTPADLSRLSGFEIRGSLRTITDVGLQTCRTSLVPSGSLILSTRAPIGSLGLATMEMCTNQGCKALVPQSGEVSRFAAYTLSIAGSALNVRGKGTTFLELSGDELASFRLAFPEREEQAAIARFLDRETPKIDALIAEQEKLLALLAEKHQVTISHAVTRGLDPKAPMKDSGIPWLGEVPAHWTVAMLRRFVAIFEQGWSPECESRVPEEGEWGVLKAGCVNGGVFDAAQSKALPSSQQPRPELEVESGDVLMSRASGSPKLIGSVAYIVDTPSKLMLSDKIFRLRLSADVDPEFFSLLMRSQPLRQQIEQAIGGAEGLANNLPQSSIKDFWLCVPPKSEQRAIVESTHTETASLRLLAEAEQRFVDLLKERRSALISAAVTGQIDVRGEVESAAA
ncbi:restriction endonuclease subunit S [Coralloluteibacterium stylophorae]|uniref:Restriction endonuclease subunit S n=1 Tax=Coralloluteibacterium stylophorae TaxID=1776034 RepID=A0A8J7VXI2_9GAMM|nr:restriction endonuclease subunit S [Coralloluteibacterium stylophorae]MBS7455710.1 restriction endonuclease subunit S [Coralloluteibacterium stylophorae]